MCLDGWIQKFDKDSTTVWMKEVPGNTVKMLKVHTTFENVEPHVLYAMFEDGSYRHVWDEAMLSDDVICKIEEGNSDIVYYAMKCPAPLRNRDFVAQRCWKKNSNDEYIVFNHSVAHEQYPPSRQFIRGLSFVTGYIIRKSENGGSFFSYLTHSDPRGMVPKWLLNIVASKISPRIVLKMAKAAEDYLDWKAQNTTLTDSKDPSLDNVPVVSISNLKEMSEEEVPLTPIKGEPDYLGGEAMLVDSEVAPNNLPIIDSMLMMNDSTEDKEDVLK